MESHKYMTVNDTHDVEVMESNEYLSVNDSTVVKQS